MEYNPVHKVLLFGAGDAGDGANPNLYRIHPAGEITRLSPPLIHINCTPTSKWMCDPVSGEFVAKALRNEAVYAFHPLRDQWRKIPGLRLPEESLGAAIDTYGVMLLLARTDGRNFRCYLYKHKPAIPADPT
jgi:hypothetical protein